MRNVPFFILFCRCMLETLVVENFTWWFGANVVVHVVFAERSQGNQVGDRFAAWLDAKFFIIISNRILLTINSSHRDCEFRWVNVCQLGYITGYVSSIIRFDFLVYILDMIFESLKVWYLHVTLNRLCQQWNATFNCSIELIYIEVFVATICLYAL